jgi:hypothetical protein
MSIVNLTAALFCPDFPQKYFVKTSILSEALSSKGKFHNIVGELREDKPILKQTKPTSRATPRAAIRLLLGVWRVSGQFHPTVRWDCPVYSAPP